MTLIRSDSALVVDTRSSVTDWCVFEHQVVMQQGEPPETILVGACPLSDVYRLADGKINSEWARIFKNGGKVLVRIVATTEVKQEAYKHAQERVRDLDPTPMCNLRGHSLKSIQRSIICHQNNRRYNTQTEAAADLNIHASAISRHMNGHISHAQGFTFAYVAGDTP